MKTYLTYALLIATWVFLVVIIVYQWVAKELTPPYWSFIILLAIAALPLASRLKIGNWFDFTKDMRQLKQDVEGNKESIKQFGVQINTMSSQIQNIMHAKQAQQQIVANFPNPETAKAFAQSLANQPDSLYRPQLSQYDNKADKNVLSFLWAADTVISSATFTLMTIYIFVVSWVEGNESVIDDKRAFQPLKQLIQDFRRICEKQDPLPIIKGEIYKHLDVLENLIDLRDSVAKGKLKPPTIKETQDIISKANLATNFIGGNVSAIAIAAALYCPPPSPRKSLSTESAS